MKRCAIYTRKSSEEGLEQGFNSLDAQREACEAYVLSQAGEGWSVLREQYDDGGFSGGSMERPGLQRLLTDIRSGKIDVVVVYKIDRLTRSLADFARIVETFDAAEVSFVSVTQAFNTTSSMGRLTLNVLLSFAQFEREVTGERIRDKIAASKAKGMWMGGLPPLGYDLPTNGSRALVVNQGDAETVRFLFRRYLELRSVYRLLADLEQLGIRSKRRVTAKGREIGGLPFSRGAMFHLLQNRVYVGDIVHKVQCFEGQHEAIVGLALFEEVQVMLAAHRRTRTTALREKSPLAGKLFDASGRRLSPTHSRGARGSIYRYYVPSCAQGPKMRIAAKALEAFVREKISQLLPTVDDPLSLPTRIVIGDGELVLNLPARFSRTVRRYLGQDMSLEPHSSEPEFVCIYIPTSLGTARRRPAIRPTRSFLPARDDILIKALRAAHDMVSLTRVGAPIIESVPRPRYLRRLIRLAFLAPDIQDAILAGTQPPELRLADLIRNPIPLDWDTQRRWIQRFTG